MSDSIGEYIDELTDSKGVSVVTVSDGWVFTFTRTLLETLIAASKEANSDKVGLFVRSSANIPKS